MCVCILDPLHPHPHLPSYITRSRSGRKVKLVVKINISSAVVGWMSIERSDLSCDSDSHARRVSAGCQDPGDLRADSAASMPPAPSALVGNNNSSNGSHAVGSKCRSESSSEHSSPDPRLPDLSLRDSRAHRLNGLPKHSLQLSSEPCLSKPSLTKQVSGTSPSKSKSKNQSEPIETPSSELVSNLSSEHVDAKDENMASTKGKTDADEEGNQAMKASIYFKVLGGRTVNRTFPGDVNPKGRQLLQAWSREFREGASSLVPDKRNVCTKAKRNGTVYVDRLSAFSWFRSSHEKYSEHVLRDEGHYQALLTGGSNSDNLLQPLPASTKISKFLPSEYRQESSKGKKGKVIENKGKEFVEIEWDSTVNFSKEPGSYFLMFGLTKVHIFTLKSGKGELASYLSYMQPSHV